MKRVLPVLLALLGGAAPVLRAGDSPFEIRAVAPRALSPADEHVLDDGEGNPVTLALGSEVLLDASALASAEAKSEDDLWIIAVELTPAGKERFAALTAKFQDRRLAVLIDGRVRCAPIVRSPVTDGSFEIAGNFTEAEVRKLVADLNAAAGKKPAPAAAATATPGNP